MSDFRPIDSIIKPGEETTEYAQHLSTSQLTTILGLVGLSGLAGTFGGPLLSPDIQIPAWAGIALIVVAGVLRLASEWGYARSRSTVKAAAIKAQSDITTAAGYQNVELQRAQIQASKDSIPYATTGQEPGYPN